MKHLCWIYALVIGAVYFTYLPHSVQMGDTGELVRAGYNLQVAHPPGYPLFIWLIHFATSIIPVGTVFWKAALLNAVFSVCALACLMSVLKTKPLPALGLGLMLAFSRIYWSYSELPDVFALHALFASALLLIYLRSDENPKIAMWFPLIAFAGLAHHHTLLFLAPLGLHLFIRNFHSKRFWVSTAAGILICSGLYLSMLSFNTLDPYSWKPLSSAQDVFDHLLRKDYGTFQLASEKLEGNFLSTLQKFSTETFFNFAALFLVLVLAVVIRVRGRVPFESRDWVLLSCLSLYIVVFFALSNLPTAGVYGDTLERFFILPQVLLCFFAAQQLRKVQLSKVYQALFFSLLAAGALFNYASHSKSNDLSKNTIIEDYAVNLLLMAPENENVSLLTYSDTRFFALQYAQNVLGVRPDIFVLSAAMLGFPSFKAKAIERGWIIGPNISAPENHALPSEDLIVSNLERFTILTNIRLLHSTKYHTEEMRLGKILRKGSGVSINEKLPSGWRLRSDPRVVHTSLPRYSVFRDLWSEYGDYHWIRANVFIGNNRLEDGRLELETALKLVPWDIPSKTLLCHLLKETNKPSADCESELAQMRAENYKYFSEALPEL